MEYQYVKIVVFVHPDYADVVRAALADAGCGHIGNYDACSFSVKGVGRFRPLDGSDPLFGETGKHEQIEEERIETICPFEKLEAVLAELKKAHPYDEPAVDIYPLLNKGQL